MSRRPSDNADRFELHLDVSDASDVPVELIAAHCDLSKSHIKQVMSKGACWIENQRGIHRLRRANSKLQQGDCLHFYYDTRVLAQEPSPAVLIADEDRYSVWDKPTGMFSQGSRWGDHCSITRWVETHIEPARDARLVHRLDRATRGLMLIAHDKKCARALSDMFAQRGIEKHYRARVEGDLTIDAPVSIDSDVDGKPAESILLESHYDVADDSSDALIKITTGRKHQVRVHMQAVGHPVIGDRLHGSSRLQHDLQLVSCYLAFDCPFSGKARRYQL